jgi:hypothetical protein
LLGVFSSYISRRSQARSLVAASPQPTLVMPRLLNKTMKKPDKTMEKLSPEPAPAGWVLGTPPAPYIMSIRQQVRALYEDDLIFQDYLTYEDDKWQQLTAAMVLRQHTQKEWQWRMGWHAIWDKPYLPMPRTLIEEYYPVGFPAGKFKCVLCVCWSMGLGQTRKPKDRQCQESGRSLPAKVMAPSQGDSAKVTGDRQRKRMILSFDNQSLCVRYTVHGHLQTPLHNMDGINTSCICIFCGKTCVSPGGVLHHMRVRHQDKVHDGEDSWKKDMEALYNVKLHC